MTSEDVERWAWIVGGVGILGSALCWIIRPAMFPSSWLAAFACFLGWPLGSLALLLVHALTGGQWGKAIQPHLASGVMTLPVVIVGIVPILATLPALYPWMHPEIASHLQNASYLNLPFFLGRMLLCLIAWFGIAALALPALRRADGEHTLRRFAPAGLIALGLTGTFAAIDLTMSLDPAFGSSVYGMLVEVQQALFALSIATFWASVTRANADSAADLGKLLLGLAVLWMYLDFMQFLIIWQSNLPQEAKWYGLRLAGGWGVVALAVIACHFIVPFFVLIWPQAQRSPRVVAIIAALLIATAPIRDWWLVLPGQGRNLGFADLAAMLALFGPGVALALRFSRSQHHSLGVETFG